MRTDWTLRQLSLVLSRSTWFSASLRPPEHGNIPTGERKRAAKPMARLVIKNMAPQPTFVSLDDAVTGNRSLPLIRRRVNQASDGCVTPQLTKIASHSPNDNSPPSTGDTVTWFQGRKFSSARAARVGSISHANTVPDGPTSSARMAV
jgi:hypothetical protein